LKGWQPFSCVVRVSVPLSPFTSVPTDHTPVVGLYVPGLAIDES